MKLLKLLRRRPLPLRALVNAIVAERSLVLLVLGAAAAEGAIAPADVEAAVVLLGADGLRQALLKQESQPGRDARGGGRPRRRAAGTNDGRLRALRKAIASDQYLVDTRAVAAAMLRDLERR
jgi:hypothetical protein